MHPHRARLVLAAALALCAARPAAAIEGFSIGLEGLRGGWDLDPERLAHQYPLEAGIFTGPVHGNSMWGAGLHLGWNVKGHAALEAVIDGTGWGLGENSTRGGAGFAGGRVTWYPAQIFLAHRGFRAWDAGLSLGSGFSIAGGPSRGVQGAYLEVGLCAEYYPVPWFSAGLFWRDHLGLWGTFLHNYRDNITSEITTDWSGSWNTFGLALTFHLVPR